ILGLLAVAGVGTAHAQQSGRVPRIAIVHTSHLVSALITSFWISKRRPLPFRLSEPSPILSSPALFSSLARPGANITGVSADVGWEHWDKRVQLLGQSVPGVSRLEDPFWGLTARACAPQFRHRAHTAVAASPPGRVCINHVVYGDDVL